MASLSSNWCINTIVDPRRAVAFHHVHYPDYFKPYYSIGETGNRLVGWEYRNDDIQLLRVTHYFTKPKKEWIERRNLGLADLSSGKGALDEFNAYDNENDDIFDDSILYYLGLMGQNARIHGHDSEGDLQG